MTAMDCIRKRLWAAAALPLIAVLAAGGEQGKARKTRILILCTGNSARSQMAAGFLASWDSHLEVHSAGTHPAPRVNPFAIRVMKEAGIDLSGGYPKPVAGFLGQSFDFVITVCDDADRNCPNFTGRVGKRAHIGFPDPAKAEGTDAEKMAVFRGVRDDIQKRIRRYYETEIRRAAAN